MRFAIALLALLAACGRFRFDDGADAGTGVLSITSPPQNAEVGATALFEGTCAGDNPIGLSGSGLKSSTGTSCINGFYIVEVTFTDGLGQKVVAITQSPGTVLRTFVRVRRQVTPGAPSRGTQPGAGFMVDCDLSIPRPPALASGQLLVGMIYSNGGSQASISTPGFSRMNLDAGTHVGFYRFATSSEPDNYVFHVVAGMGAADTCESAGVLVAFENVDPASPIVAQSANVDGDDTDVVARSVTTGVPGLLVGLWGANGPAAGFTPPEGMTIDGTRAVSDFASVMIAWEAIGDGATGDRTAANGATRAAAAALVVLRPRS